MIKILLAEDHNIVRNGIRKLLEDDENISVTAEAVNGNQVLEHIGNKVAVDIILADINMPEIDGISLTNKIKALYPGIKVVILSMHDHKKYVIQAFQAGAYGYLIKSIEPGELIFAIKYICNGGRYLCAELSMAMLDNEIFIERNKIAADESTIEFSSREIDVLQLIANGETNQEMSEKLFLSKRTIEGHRQSLIEKTKSRNTAALIRYAVMHRIIL